MYFWKHQKALKAIWSRKTFFREEITMRTISCSLPGIFFCEDIYQFRLQTEGSAWPRERTLVGKRETSSPVFGCVGLLWRLRNLRDHKHITSLQNRLCWGLGGSSWGRRLEAFEMQSEISWSLELFAIQNILEEEEIPQAHNLFFPQDICQIFNLHRTEHWRVGYGSLENISGSLTIFQD